MAEKEGKAKLTAKVEGGLRDLLGVSYFVPVSHSLLIRGRTVLKSTGSAFEDFFRDEYTTLAEVNDRILSTSIDLAYTFVPFTITAPTDEKKLEFGEANCCEAAKVRLSISSHFRAYNLNADVKM